MTDKRKWTWSLDIAKERIRKAADYVQEHHDVAGLVLIGTALGAKADRLLRSRSRSKTK